MKLAVSSYSYNQYITSNRMDIFSVIEHAAETGFKGIEFIEFTTAESNNFEAFCDKVRHKCLETGLEICAYAVGGDFSTKNIHVEVKRLKSQVDVAARLGAPVMRTDVMNSFPDGIITSKQCRGHIADGLRDLADYAQSKGVLLTTENHGWIFGKSEWLEKLMSWVNHNNYRLLADLGNFMHAGREPAVELSRLVRFVRHVHIKDFHFKSGSEFFPGKGWFETCNGDYIRGAIVGHGDAQIQKSLRILNNNGYNGWLTLEFEGIEDALMAITAGLTNIQRMLVEQDTSH